MSDFLQATNSDPTINYMEKVRKAVNSNHPAEIAYRDGSEKRKAAAAAEVEYDRREYVDETGTTYVIEDREDGAYVIARQSGDEPIRSYGDEGLKIDNLPESAIEKDVMDRVGEFAGDLGQVAEGSARGIGLGLTKFVTNVARSAVDNPIGDFVIGDENVEAFEQFSKEFLENADEVAGKSAFGEREEFDKPGQVAKVVGDVTGQFIAPAGGMYKLLRTAGAGPLLSSIVADGFVGFAGVAPEEENIANLIPEDSEAFGLLRDLLATDPDDGEFENRAKNAVEAMALLGVGEAAGRGIVRALKSGKKAIDAVELPENVGKAIDRNVDNALKSGAAATGAAALAPADANASVEEKGALDSYLERLRQIESSNDPLARNPNSSAKGLYQFIDSTGKEFGLDKFQFGTPEYTQAEHKAVLKLTAQNRRGLKKVLGREPTQGELYLAHQQGLGGATKLLTNPTKPAVDILGRDQVKLNGGHEGMSGLSFARMWTKKFDKGPEGGVEVAGLGNEMFKLLADSMKKSGPSNEAVEAAGKVLKDGSVIMPEDNALQIRQALENTGSAEGIDFNLSRMETPDQLNNMIDEISEIYKEPIAQNKRGVETFNETQAKSDLARMTGFDVEQVISRQPGELWPAHKIKAARDIFVSELSKTEDLARAIKEGGNTSENLIAFRRQLAVVSAVQSQIKGVQTETARALSQYRMTAKSPMEVQVNLSEMIQKSGGAEMNETLVDAYLNVIENGGPEAAATFARNAEQVTGMDMLYEAWINSLLGSPATHAVNMLGNSLTINQAVIERYAAATYGSIERGVQRALGKQATEGITFKEANAFATGQAMAVNDSMMAFAKALRDGEGSDIFGKLDVHQQAITTQNINELPLAKTITSKLMQGDELVQSNSQLAHMIDFMGEYYYRLPGRFLMAEDEFFKSMNYRAELHSLAAREAAEQGLSQEEFAARYKEILADPQLNAPELHRQALDFSREQTFTTPPGEVASRLSNFLNNARIGDFPAGRVVVPFFNVINNITKYVGGRVPGLGLINPNSKTYQDFFSKDPAKRQLVMGKWATGSSLLGFGAYSAMNGHCTGRMSDNGRMVSQMEQTQGKKRYSCHLPGTDRMMNYNRLEPAGMLMAISADTATALAYADPEERENLVLAATAAVVPYMEDKSFFEGISRFFEAFNPQYGNDDQRAKALGRYFSDLLSTAGGAIGGPAAPGTPLSRNVKTNIMGDRAKRIAEANKWEIQQDKYGDDILVANSESYQIWERAINKIYGATPGLSESLPADVNIWGEEIIYEGGLGPDFVTPIYTNTPKYDIKDLRGKNFPPQIEAGRFKDMRVGSDLTIEQHREFVDVVGINGELERLNMPLNKPRREISARVNGKSVGLPVEMNHDDRIDLIKIMNEIRVPNDAHPDRKRMNLQETLNWMIKEPEYAKLPDDRDATGAKGDLIRKVYNEYKGAAVELFFAEHPNGQAYFRRSVEMKQKAQNTGVQ